MLSRKRRAAFPSIDGGATGGPHGERSLCHGCAFSTASRWRAMRSFSGYFQGPCSFPTSIFSYERSAIVTAMIAGDASGCHVPDAKAVSRGSHLRSRIGLRTPPAGTQMRAAALAAAVVAAFVGVMYLRFASDSVPKPPAGAGGPQCVVFRNVSDGNDARAQATCSPRFESPPAPVVMQPRTPMGT